MDVVYSSSDAYSEIAGISMVSLFENNKDEEQIVVYIIDNEIKTENKKNLQLIVDAYQRELIFLTSVDIEKMAGTKINVGRWHISTFYRLLLGLILPKSVERVMYIDCDMIILHSLHSIWNMDMQGYYAMGADDCRGGAYRTNIGLPENHIYINNGFLLIDLKAWRENDIEKQYLDFILRYNGDITYMDQGVLNGVLGTINKVGLLPPSYNAQTVFYDFTYDQINMYRRPVWAYTKSDFQKMIADPTIVHFTSCFISGTRPWNTKNNHPYRNMFLAYRTMTPWKDRLLWEDDRKIPKKIMTVVCQHIPKTLLLSLFFILHSKLYPVVRNIKNDIIRKRKCK